MRVVRAVLVRVALVQDAEVEVSPEAAVVARAGIILKASCLRLD